MTGADVLVVDDHPAVQRGLMRILAGAGYQCRAAGSVAEAMDLMSVRVPDLVLCDIDMPSVSGLVLVDHLRSTHPEVAVVMVTGQDDPEVAAEALRLGAHGYMIKPCERNEVVINAYNALRQRQLEIEAKARSDEEMVRRLAWAAEYRDPETAQHLERMSRYSALLARAAGWDDARTELMRLASPMHDIGKIGIPDEILLKNGKFTDEDRVAMSRHCEIGYRILSGSDSPLLALAAQIAFSHHERWDGSGYPNHLCAQEIPLEGRIVAIADVFDALTSERRYKPAFTFERAEEIMLGDAGSHFDPDLVAMFFELRAEIELIRETFSDDQVAAMHGGGAG